VELVKIQLVQRLTTRTIQNFTSKFGNKLDEAKGKEVSGYKPES